MPARTNARHGVTSQRHRLETATGRTVAVRRRTRSQLHEFGGEPGSAGSVKRRQASVSTAAASAASMLRTRAASRMARDAIARNARHVANRETVDISHNVPRTSTARVQRALDSRRSRFAQRRRRCSGNDRSTPSCETPRASFTTQTLAHESGFARALPASYRSSTRKTRGFDDAIDVADDRFAAIARGAHAGIGAEIVESAARRRGTHVTRGAPQPLRHRDVDERTQRAVDEQQRIAPGEP